MQKDGVSSKTDLQAVEENIFNFINLIIGIFALPLLLFSILRVFYTGFMWVYLLHIAVVSIIWFIYLFRKIEAFKPRVLILILSMAILMLPSIPLFGINARFDLMLILYSFIVGMFLRQRIAILIILILVLYLSVCSYNFILSPIIPDFTHLFKSEIFLNLLFRFFMATFFSLVIIYSIERYRSSIIKAFNNFYSKRKAEESEHLYRAIFENLIGGFYKTDVNGNIVLASPSAMRITGFKEKEFLGIHATSFFANPDEREVFLEKLKKNGKVERYRAEFRTKKRGIIFIEINAKLVFNRKGEYVGVEGIFYNITEKVKAKENELKFVSIAEQINEGSTISDVDGKYTFVNPAFCKLTGYSEKELLEMTIFDVIKTSSDSSNLLENVDSVKQPLEVIFVHKDGSGIYAEIKMGLITITGKQFIISIIHDISKRVIYQQDLIKAKEKAEESDRLKSAFLANISHEIRTPMNGILGFISLLKQFGLSKDEQLEYLDIIEKGGERMLNTMNDIIDISRIETDLIDISHSLVNINEELGYLYEFFKHDAEKKGIQLSFKYGLKPQNSIIKSDKEKIVSIITNLVKNAIKFTHEGSIELGYKLKNENLEFYIKDTGIGIPEDRIEAIFNQFVKADIEDTHVFEGSGLGLSISKAYVEMLGGQIWVESEVGVGSQFYFTMPYNTNSIVSVESKETSSEIIVNNPCKELENTYCS